MEEAPQLALANAQPLGQRFDSGGVHRTAFYQCERSRNRVGGPAPRSEVRRYFRPASQAWPEPCLLGCRRRRKENHILALGGSGRTDRPAVNPGRLNRHEQPTVEPGVARRENPVAGIMIHVHTTIIAAPPGLVSR